MGLKPMDTDSEPKQRCGSISRMTSGLTLMPFRASANAVCPEPHHLQGHLTCLRCPQGLEAVYGDGWMDGRTNGRRTDGWIVGWLVGCLRQPNDPFRQYLSLYRTVSQREREKEKSGDS